MSKDCCCGHVRTCGLALTASLLSLAAQAMTPHWTPRSRRCSSRLTRASARGCCRWDGAGQAGQDRQGGPEKWCRGGGELVGTWWAMAWERVAHCIPKTLCAKQVWPKCGVLCCMRMAARSPAACLVAGGVRFRLLGIPLMLG